MALVCHSVYVFVSHFKNALFSINNHNLLVFHCYCCCSFFFCSCLICCLFFFFLFFLLQCMFPITLIFRNLINICIWHLLIYYYYYCCCCVLKFSVVDFRFGKTNVICICCAVAYQAHVMPNSNRLWHIKPVQIYRCKFEAVLINFDSWLLDVYNTSIRSSGLFLSLTHTQMIPNI